MNERSLTVAGRGLPPCSPDCSERSARCHAECRAYLDWRAKSDAMRAEERRRRDAEHGLSEHERAKDRRRRSSNG